MGRKKMTEKTETQEPEKQPTIICETPKFKVTIWFEAKTQPIDLYNLEMLGFEIEAYSPEYIKLNPKGFNKFPEGAWVTVDDLHQFIDGLTEIMQKIDGLPLFGSTGVNTLWEGDLTE
jgi:hypothetical protein